MSLRPRPEVEALQTCPHGGPDHAELRALGLDPAKMLDFSVCSNPFMPPPKLGRLVSALDIEQYPDSTCAELRERLSERVSVPVASILCGSGTIELIRLIALAYFRPGDTVLILSPTFGEYEVAALIAGARVMRCTASADDGFAPDMVQVLGLIRQHRPRAVFACNPNNPTGSYLSRKQVERLLDTVGDGILVLDEAYVAFVDGSWPATELLSQGNVVLLRSMTKDYALAGLRLGYTISSTGIIEALRRVCPPWNVNAVAQRVGAAILAKEDLFERTRPRIQRAKAYLTRELSRLGWAVMPSKANYFLVRVGDARSFRSALLKQGVMVRDCASFGLPEYVRIAPRPMAECRRLIQAVKEIRKRNPPRPPASAEAPATRRQAFSKGGDKPGMPMKSYRLPLVKGEGEGSVAKSKPERTT